MMSNFEIKLITFLAFLMLATMLTCAVFAIVAVFDGLLSYEVIGEKSVPCIDKNNRPFENELCKKKITCSYLGLAGQKRCVNVLGDES